MPGTTLPPFPDNVHTHPLVVIDFDLLEAGNSSEIDRLWGAATSIGFWYLKNHGADKEVDDMFDLGPKIMALPLEEKMKFLQTNGGPWFGYRNAGTYAVDAAGQSDSTDSFTISKDDVLAFPKVVQATYPDVATDAIPTVFGPFVRKSLKVNNTIIRIFNDRLGLPEGMLQQLHSDEELSFTAANLLRVRPMPKQAVTEKLAMSAHTDFGTLSLLHNRLGGLQVIPPGHTEWSYVKPLPGHAICNIGDALAIFSGGILKSNIHRVVRPPGDQGEHERWSLVLFGRANNSTVLRAFTEDSPLIAEAVQKHPNRNFNTGQTAGEWFMRRVQNRTLKNYKGPETWAASKGTEAWTET